MTEQEKDYEAPETEEVDAGSPEPQKRNVEDSRAIDQFLADKRHIRFEDTANNWDTIADWLSQHDLPVTVCSLAVAFEQLSESGELELLSPGRERTPDEKTEGELQAERQKQAEPEGASGSEISKDARAMLQRFQRRNAGAMIRHKNGALVG